jgi:small-conductance mechanosensitive channel
LLLPGLILLLAAGVTVAAQDGKPGDWIAEAKTTLATSDATLSSTAPGTLDIGQLGSTLKQVATIRSRAQECVSEAEKGLEKLAETLASLGEAQAPEPVDIRSGRKELEDQRKALEQRLASCRLLVVQAEDMAGRLTEAQQAILAERLLAHGPDIVVVTRANLASPAQWLVSLARFIELQGEGLPTSRQSLVALLALVLGAGLGIGLRRVLFRSIPVPRDDAGSAASFGHALRIEARRDLSVWCALALPTVYLLTVLPLGPLPFVTTAAIGLTLLALTLSLINVLLIPRAPARDWLTQPPEAARTFGRRLKLLAVLGLIGYLLFSTGLRQAITPDLYLLLRALFATVLILNLVTIAWIMRRLSWALFGRGMRLLLMAALLGVLVAEYLGYRNLAKFLLGGFTGSMIGLGIALLLTVLLTDLYDGIDEGRLAWQRRLRVYFNLKERVPGLAWLRILTLLAIWGALLAWLLSVWDLSEQVSGLLMLYLTDGFTLGSLKIIPAYLLGGILTFALLLSFSRYLKQSLVPRWLRHTRLDQGAREAVAAITGYTGIAIAVLVALSITGVAMQNLAIIAGALSVGIGFGLQNIVNNFVSGLILLFERPIRRGDWIVAGATEGYVKSINIRSTQIQTFDRADVIVPNSELISQQVTNWMLSDPFGRVVVPVGVSYDSDPDQVREVLLKVANAHPLVLNGHPVLASPRVLFRRFGDSSLDFELRCFISQIDERLTTISELNFEIFRAFRHEGIEIPFPQRDLHLRGWPGREDDKEPTTLPPG